METETAPEDENARAEWYARLEEFGNGEGEIEFLGRHHAAIFIEETPTLLVSFESAAALRAKEEELPLGLRLADEAGWSQLTILAEGETWFRDHAVYSYFDRLVDDGFFDGFDRVVFYGAGMCGYAAAAFSVAAPGATVIAVGPQATLDPRVTEWDERFVAHRRLSFTDRYGYAPDMLEAAEHAFVLYDPEERFDAMHAALFTRTNVSKLRCRFLGEGLEGHLSRMGILGEMIDAACEDKLTEAVFHRLFRSRRNYGPYLRKMLIALHARHRRELSFIMCRNVVSRLRAPRFRKRMEHLTEELEAEGRPLPLERLAPSQG
ncbi:MAG: phosphoadenosine phosphosulfate reductase [Paracoccaceae bacterium]